MDKKVTVKLGNVEYVWHNKTWVTHNNLTVSTSLAQKLNALALQSNLLTREDLVVEKKSR